MATKEVIKIFVCTFCDAEIHASKKPKICIECGNKDPFEQIKEAGEKP